MNQLMRLLLSVFFIAMMAMTTANAAGRRISTSDTIQIHVLNQPDLDTQVRVAPDGTISYPYVGRIRAAGLTEDDIAARIKAALARADIVKDAQVVISVVTFGTQISVQGAVQSPGVYPLDRPTTLTEALSRAGGVTRLGWMVVLRRRTPSGVSVQRFDVKTILAGNPFESNIVLQNSDDIYVEEASVYYLAGYVNKPGEYPLARKLSVQQALVAGGGIADLGSVWGLQVKRRQPDGSFVVGPISLDDEVQPMDIILVPERLF
jgi:polysaccharide export outer membrane protein